MGAFSSLGATKWDLPSILPATTQSPCTLCPYPLLHSLFLGLLLVPPSPVLHCHWLEPYCAINFAPHYSLLFAKFDLDACLHINLFRYQCRPKPNAEHCTLSLGSATLILCGWDPSPKCSTPPHWLFRNFPLDNLTSGYENNDLSCRICRRQFINDLGDQLDRVTLTVKEKEK